MNDFRDDSLGDALTGRPREDGPLSEGDRPTMPGGAAGLGRIDRYELLEVLGGGGFGVVFRARDTVAGIEVAVKGLPPLVQANKEELERVRENFALVSRLHHPHIAAPLVLHEARQVWYASEPIRRKLRVMEGDYLFVMSFAPGVTLSKWRKQFPGGKVPVDQALDICRQIAEALDYAHSQKIMHRDIKPSNVVVETTGAGVACRVTARVLDFGLAAEIRSSMSRISKETGDTSGTRPYMAPEQWAGRKQGAATDQYALAVLFYELVSGAVPFAPAFETGDPAIMERAIETRMPDALPELTKRANAALLKGLAKNPSERFADCRSLVAGLGGVVNEKSAKGIKTAKVGRGHRPGRWLARAAIVVVLAALGLGVWQGVPKWKHYQESRRAEQAADAYAGGDYAAASEQWRGAAIGYGQAEEWAKDVAAWESAKSDWEKALSETDRDLVRQYGRETWDRAQAQAATGARSADNPKAGADAYRQALTLLAQAVSNATAKATPSLIIETTAGDRSVRGKVTAGTRDWNGPKTERVALDESTEPRLGDTRRVDLGNEVYLDLVWIPATTSEDWKRISGGKTTFTMGSPPDEPGRFDNESPLHEVTISRGFWMGKTEVTQKQYQQLMGVNPSHFTGAGVNAPVERVTWHMATNFSARLQQRLSGDLQGKRAGLPTEAEWEYACRAGTTTAFYFGRCLSTDQANYDGNYALEGCAKGQYRQTTTRVDLFPANAWGLHDMHGNVWEWCQDGRRTYSRAAITDPGLTDTSGSSRVLRGGSWDRHAGSCRSAYRDYDDPGDRFNLIGFRVVVR